MNKPLSLVLCLMFNLIPLASQANEMPTGTRTDINGNVVSDRQPQLTSDCGTTTVCGWGPGWRCLNNHQYRAECCWQDESCGGTGTGTNTGTGNTGTGTGTETGSGTGSGTATNPGTGTGTGG